MDNQQALGSGKHRLRGPQACENCHERKIRCDVSSNGTPCTACSTNSTSCNPRARKSYKPRRTQRNLEVRSASVNEHQDRPRATDTKPLTEFRTSLSSPSYSSSAVVDSPSKAWDSGEASSDPALDKNRSDAVKFVAAITGDSTSPGEAPIFIGDQQGIGSILEVLRGDRGLKSQHYTIPRSKESSLDSDDLTYLNSKGCFSLPAHIVCETLIQSYFRHVHPSLPILDAKAVLEPYTTIGIQKVNLLLLWSMFSVSASYIDIDVVILAGYKTRREMKQAMYKRGKCLYDNGYEEDRVSLLQCAILLGFWFSDAEDRTATWHWTGVAISLAQTLGFHRGLSSQNFNVIPIARQRLWRRIWWCCFFRDRWISQGMGRPMRINPEDCDVALPSVEDVLNDIQSLPESVSATYLPPDLVTLAVTWLNQVRLSTVLGDILMQNYRPRKSKLKANEVETLERRVAELSNDISSQTQSDLSKVSEKIFQLYKEAALIVLFRPYIDEHLSRNSSVSSTVAKQKIKLAATSTISTLDSIIASDSVVFLGPMM